MNQKAVVELLLARMNSLRASGGTAFGALDGTPGSINILARDMNKALGAWHETGDTTGLLQMAGTLAAMGTLNEKEYDYVLQALDPKQ